MLRLDIRISDRFESLIIWVVQEHFIILSIVVSFCTFILKLYIQNCRGNHPIGNSLYASVIKRGGLTFHDKQTLGECLHINEPSIRPPENSNL